MMKAIKILMLSTVIFVIASCSSTMITSSWKSPQATNLGSKKIMVIALLPDKNRALQQSMENQLVSELKERGVQALSAFTTFGPKFSPQDEEKALKKLDEKGVHAVLTIVLLNKDKDKQFNPGNASIYPVGYYRSWFGYYQTVYSRVYSPGYYTSSTKFFWESNLYDMDGTNGKKLLYSAQSQSFDPSSISKLATEYSNKIVNDMAKQGLLPSKDVSNLGK